MRRLAFSLLTVLLLAACAGAPQKTSSRGSSSAVNVTNGAYRAPPPGFPNFVDHSIGREEISIQAMSLVGVPYRWGGNTPDSGFDCSGLVRYVVSRAASVNLPRTTADMSGRGESVEPDEIAPGDLIFFNTTGRAHSHVGIYVGKLRFVNAPSTGGTVRLDYLTNPYWAKRFDGIRRVAGPAAKPVPFDAPSYQAAAPQTERAVTQAASTADRSGDPSTANAPLASTRAVPVYATGSSASPVTARAGAEPRAPATSPSTAAAAPALAATAATRAPQADPFEPPPPAMSAAQIQARAAGAKSPTPALSAQASGYDGGAGAQAQQQAGAATPPVSQTAAARGADAIDAAADAFEPPPPSSVATRQARQARQADPAERTPGDNGSVQIMRASTASRGVAAPSQTNDDPIARFANGNF
ncbi:MAG: Cell wall-associated hydrolases (invasion-associated proteins) [uncultured Paraburkholderia sp.]|uniref:NlpC/P60 family protein n=1 Tax=uncultured Paraburkholderia sp. TaxID=1822466 RepID=UPI00259AB0EA|nr:NlpC/P60 family protein [uncultured Paraburkholderia sp.]CAH2894207.1 MAG: Cell wall-associated hydrolases (invasion-associated proteins) [uncultured Paraburkholderia sp.]CAH2911589.1 MAG: Cell wall-associated hydrolases (invasion-associated proteins) [uncultured Paraburkholderia sp.]